MGDPSSKVHGRKAKGSFGLTNIEGDLYIRPITDATIRAGPHL
ncbi:MAG TPA: hypothetical protein VF178_01640 [Gemmatimonadaceae bacterium]